MKRWNICALGRCAATATRSLFAAGVAETSGNAPGGRNLPGDNVPRCVASVTIPVLVLSACVYLPGPQQMSEAEVRALVNDLPAGPAKTVSLAILANPDSKYRIDHNGYPTWRWRGVDDIGGCVHIDPKTKRPYLENQFPRSTRTEVPKYIDFGTDNRDWQCRIHHFRLGREVEKNWSTPACHSQGKALLKLLTRELQPSAS